MSDTSGGPPTVAPSPLRRALRRGLPGWVALAAASASLLALLASPWGSALQASERVWTLAHVPAARPAREVVVLDLEGWPTDPFLLDQVLTHLASGDAGRPALVVLDALGYEGFTRLSLWIDEGSIQPELTFFDPDGPSLRGRLLVATTYASPASPGEGALPGGPSHSPREPELRPLAESLTPAFAGAGDLAPPALSAAPLTAIEMYRRGEDGVVRGLGLALTAALLCREPRDTGGPLPATPELTRGDDLVLPGRLAERLRLDGGRLWLTERPSESRFERIPAVDYAKDPAPFAHKLDGRVLVIGAVRGEHEDWHPTPWGWTPGALLQAQAIEQLLAGRSYRPCPGWLGALLSLATLFAAAGATWYLDRLPVGLLLSASLGLTAAAASVAGVWACWTLLPAWTPGLGAALGCSVVASARWWQLRQGMAALRGMHGTGSTDPLGIRLRRIWILRSVANELVLVRNDSAGEDDPAYAKQEKEQLLFRNPERILRRVAGQRWESGTTRGLQEVIELLYQGLYETSGDLKRIPQLLKGPDAWIFVLKHLRNHFDHSYEVKPKIREHLNLWLADREAPLLGDLDSAQTESLLRLQLALLDEGVRFAETVEADLRRLADLGRPGAAEEESL